MDETWPDYFFLHHSKAVAAGWGALKEGGTISDTLQEVTVPILSNSECRKTGYGTTRITDNMLCAGLPKGGKDSCQVSEIDWSIIEENV